VDEPNPVLHGSLLRRLAGLYLAGAWSQVPAHRVKYLPEIDLLCFDGQPSCLRGETDDSTERCEGADAVPVASKTATDGAPLRTAPWADSGRTPIRGQREDDSALARAVAPGWARGGLPPLSPSSGP